MNGNPHQTHILVIDEQRSERKKLEKELREVGFDYRMSSCPGEAEALKAQMMKDATVDVVLCPYSLQGTNALKLLRVIRDTGSEVPVILLALDLAEDIAIELLSAGMEDYVHRASLKRLSVAIRKAIQRHQTQQQLKRSEATLKEAQRIAKVGSWEWEVGSPMAWASEELHRQLGSATGSEWAPLAEVLPRVNEQDREVMMQHLSNPDLRKEMAVLEFRYTTPSGKERTLVSRTVVAQNDGIGPAVLRGILQDVTEERLLEREKQESRRLLDNIFASVPDAMIYTDGNHMIQWASDSVQKVLGYRPDELKGLSIANLFYNVELYLKTVEEVLKNGEENRPYIAKRRYRKKGGEVFHAETIGVMIKRPDGSLQGFLTSTRDISERNEVEERLRASEQLFRDMADNITEVFWLTDYQANRVLYMSPQYERLFGMPVQSIYDAPASWASHIHPEDRPGVVERFKHDASLGTYDVEYRILLPDGQLFWVRDKAFPIRDENGVVLRIAGISKDITAEKLGRA
jgi:PAS domain S-box-containing protein